MGGWLAQKEHVPALQRALNRHYAVAVKTGMTIVFMAGQSPVDPREPPMIHVLKIAAIAEAHDL